MGDTDAQCVVTDFGRSIKSVVVVITLVESIVVAINSNDIEYFVYEYEYGVFTPENVSTLQWGGDVFMTGDYEVPDGTDLVIDSGTGVHVWPEDLASDGINTGLIEVLIDGECSALGTSVEPIQFTGLDMEGVSTADDSWWGISILDGGSAEFEHCVFRNVNYAVQGNDEVSLVACLIEDTKHIGVSVAYAGTVMVDSTTIRGPRYGINALLGTDLTLSHSVIEDCSEYGVALYKDSKLNASKTTFDGNDIGLYLSRENESWVKGRVYDCTFTGNGDGIWIDDVGDTVVVDKCTIDDNTTNGIYIADDGDVTVKRSTITNNTIGIYDNGGNSEIRSHNVIQNNSAGVKFDNYSVAVVESSTVNNNTTGFAVLNDANPDLGHTTGGSSVGRNFVRPNSGYHVANFTSNTVSAQKNYWPRTPPTLCSPLSSKFLGSVDYSDDLGCTAPSLVSIAPPPPTVGDTPTSFGVSQNYPNPFNPTTTISYEVPSPGSHVEIALYDVAGRLVTTLVDERKIAGAYYVGWNGRDSRGEPVASGVYFLRMRAGSFLATKKLVMLK